MDPKQFGLFLSEERKAKNLTQKELAEKLGVTDKAISKWERGVCLPDVAKFDDIAAALDLTDLEVLRAKRIPPEPQSESAPEKAAPLFVVPREVGRLLLGCFLVTFPCFALNLIQDFVVPPSAPPLAGYAATFLQYALCLALGIWLALRETKHETRLNWRSVFDCALVLAALAAAFVFAADHLGGFALFDLPDRLFGIDPWDFTGGHAQRYFWYQRYLNRQWTPKLLLYIYSRYEIFDFPGLFGLLQCLVVYPIAKLLRIQYNQKKQAKTKKERAIA